MSFSTSSRASGLSSINKRSDFLRVTYGYLDALTIVDVLGGKGLGSRMARGQDAKERRSGRYS